MNPSGIAEAPDGFLTEQIGHVVTRADVERMIERYGYDDPTREILVSENLLPPMLLSRLHALYPKHSGFLENAPFLFHGREHYSGLAGFREVVKTLEANGIHIGHIRERELFIEVYRFLATRHALNSINWQSFQEDAIYQLVLPQPGMIPPEVVKAYQTAPDDAERTRVAVQYKTKTNPHDGHQLLNKPWMETPEGGIDILAGSQHKYPQCQLIFDKTTQNCFAFCTYCFRHAQVRGDEDMFLQHDIDQVHAYLRKHPEVTDLLITGGDAGFMPHSRLSHYVTPILNDPSLWHIRTLRLASRALTYHPEMILKRSYDKMLALFDALADSGVQLAWMAHFSTPRELLNPSTVAAIRRLQKHGVVIRSQSPMMNHISLFFNPDGTVNIEKSAQNWVDLANILAPLRVGFHSMYCARPTGEHHYFTAPLAEVEKIFNLIYRSLSSINRPSRYITMTTSAGKISILGVCIIGGKKTFALKFNEARNMEWMDRVFLATWNDTENRVDFLRPFDTDRFFYEDELREIEQRLMQIHGKEH